MALSQKKGKRISLMQFVLTLVVLGVVLWYVNPAHALIASPARIEIEGDPGETVAGKLSLVNNQDETITYFSSLENFEAQEESGVPFFVESDEDLATWITADRQVVLEPGERKEMPFAIDIPADAGVGGHFAAIFWGTTPPDVKGSEIAVGAKTGILVFLRVRGDIVEKGEVIEMDTLTGKKLLESLPVDLFYRFENKGNDRTKPVGDLVVKNMFGREVAKIAANKKQGSVLPESVRKFYISWERENMDNIEKKFEDGTLYPKRTFFEKVKDQAAQFAMGRYSVMLSLNYGLQNNNAQAEINFWIIPWQLLVVVFVILFMVVSGGKFMLRRYNKSVIDRAQKEQGKKYK